MNRFSLFSVIIFIFLYQFGVKFFLSFLISICKIPTRCRPSKGRRCIPDVFIWVHVETYLNVYGHCEQHKLKIVYRT